MKTFLLCTTLAASLVAALPTAAVAQPVGAPAAVQLDPFEPMPTQGINLLNVASSDVLPHMSASAGLTSHPTWGILEAPNAERQIFEFRWNNSIWAAIGLVDRLELAIAMPILLDQQGDEDLAVVGRPYTEADQPFGIVPGDLRLVPKLRIVSRPTDGGLGLAALAHLYLPTGAPEALMTDSALRLGARLILDYLFPGDILLAANLAYQWRPQRRLAELQLSDDTIRWGLAAATPVGLESLRLILTFSGQAVVFEQTDRFGTALQQPAPAPLEVDGAIRWWSRSGWLAQVGLGTGLNDGLGAPDLRLLFSVGYTPGAAEPRDASPLLD